MQAARMHVEPLPLWRRGEWTVIQAKVWGHSRRRRNGRLFFEVPTEFVEWLPIQDRADDRHDIFLSAVLMSAMEAGRDLVIHGNVSATLLANLEVYQRVISNCWPHYHTVNLRASHEVTDHGRGSHGHRGQAVLGFSGGMDSTHSLYCHQRGLRGRNSRDIPICLFVHGFDIRLDDPAYDVAFTRVERIAKGLGSRLVPVRTNLKRMLPYWLNTYSSGLAAVLSLFSRRFSEAVFASAVEYNNPRPLVDGSSSFAMYDQLFSTHDFQIFPDIADESRVMKTRILRDCEIARRHIRVCWAGDDLTGNCGQCAKCVRQMLAMRALGIDDLPAFRHPLRTEHVRALDATVVYIWLELSECLKVADTNGHGQQPEFRALRNVLDRDAKTLAATGSARLLGTPHAPTPERKPRLVRWAERFSGYRRAA